MPSRPGPVGAGPVLVSGQLAVAVLVLLAGTAGAGIVAADLLPGAHEGLRGLRIGTARVSEKHANFIVNPGRDARAADIEALIGHVRRVVRERTGVDLEPEVRIVGDAEGAPSR